MKQRGKPGMKRKKGKNREKGEGKMGKTKAKRVHDEQISKLSRKGRILSLLVCGGGGLVFRPKYRHPANAIPVNRGDGKGGAGPVLQPLIQVMKPEAALPRGGQVEAAVPLQV